MCSGMGECRKKLDGTMCPSYMGTLDEEHSTRGRANALRNVIAGLVPKAEFTGKRLYEVMDLCLECKACKAECPSNVDMAKLKYEFLDHYHRANGLPLRNRIFGAIATFNRIGSTLAPVSNWLANSSHQPLAHGRSLPASTDEDRCRCSPAKLSKIGFGKHPQSGQSGQGRGGVVPRHVQQLQHAQRRHCRRRAFWRNPAIVSCSSIKNAAAGR